MTREEVGAIKRYVNASIHLANHIAIDPHDTPVLNKLISFREAATEKLESLITEPKE
jgi:hypothetical protein